MAAATCAASRPSVSMTRAPEGRGSGNSRNGFGSKTVRGDFGEVQIETPRDRN